MQTCKGTARWLPSKKVSGNMPCKVGHTTLHKNTSCHAIPQCVFVHVCICIRSNWCWEWRRGTWWGHCCNTEPDKLHLPAHPGKHNFTWYICVGVFVYYLYGKNNKHIEINLTVSCSDRLRWSIRWKTRNANITMTKRLYLEWLRPSTKLRRNFGM